MRTVFIGTGEIGLPSLKYLIQNHELVGVVTQPDKPAGRKQELYPPATKTVALEHGIPVFQPERIKRPEALATIAEWTPEVIVVMAYGQILPKALLDLPPVACLNLHASILPRHRGAAPIQAAIDSGDPETGITVMYMDVGLDTGDILLIEKLPITPETTGGTLHDALGELAPVALHQALTLLTAGNAPRLPQDNEKATHVPKLTREDGIIDWTQPVQKIDRRIRAFDPWPGTSTTLSNAGHSQKLKLARARIDSLEGILAPGEVRLDASRLLVGCGMGTLELLEVQPEGKRRMPVAAFLNGHPIHAGAKLG